MFYFSGSNKVEPKIIPQEKAGAITKLRSIQPLFPLPNFIRQQESRRQDREINLMERGQLERSNRYGPSNSV